MELKITRDQNFESVSLSETKSILRINHSLEDSKITNLIKSAYSYWENQTGYVLNATGIEISLIPSRDIILSDYPKSANYLSNSRVGLYSPPLAIDIETQKPSFVSYTDYRNDNVQKALTPEQLNSLSAGFFNMVQKVPLQFYLYYKNFPTFFSLFGGYGEIGVNRQYHGKIIMRLVCRGLEIEDDIKGCLLRIIAGLYENPDVSAENLSNDVLINDTLATYNCTMGLSV